MPHHDCMDQVSDFPVGEKSEHVISKAYFFFFTGEEMFRSESFSWLFKQQTLFSEDQDRLDSSWYDPFKPKHNLTAAHSSLMDVPLRSFISSGANQGRSLNSLPHSLECMISFLGSRRDPAASERSLPIPLMCVWIPFPPTKALLCLPAHNQGLIIKTKIIVIETKPGDHQRAAFDSIWALQEALGLWIWQILLGPNLNGPQRVCLPPFVYMAEIWNKCEHDTPCPLRSRSRAVRSDMCIHCVWLQYSIISVYKYTLHKCDSERLSYKPSLTRCLLMYLYRTRKAKINWSWQLWNERYDGLFRNVSFLCIHIYGCTNTYIIILV